MSNIEFRYVRFHYIRKQRLIGCVFLGESKNGFVVWTQIIWILYYLKNGRSEKGSFTMTTECPRALRDEKTEEKIKTTN